jgi:hypothetical protein
MKKLTGILLALALTSTVNLTTARGQTNSLWTIDENGPALFAGGIVGIGNVGGYSNGAYQTDPVSGLVGWYYPLLGPNFPTLAGDVLLLEPLAPTNTVSDLLRFDGKGGVYFFSDLEPGEPNPDHADVPFMPNPIDPVILTEVGPEGNNGAFYLPGPGMPGFDATGQVLGGLAYNFISEVPEPPAFALAGLGVAAMLILRRRR